MPPISEIHFLDCRRKHLLKIELRSLDSLSRSPQLLETLSSPPLIVTSSRSASCVVDFVRRTHTLEDRLSFWSLWSKYRISRCDRQNGVSFLSSLGLVLRKQALPLGSYREVTLQSILKVWNWDWEWLFPGLFKIQYRRKFESSPVSSAGQLE